jgi:hypothetical protein
VHDKLPATRRELSLHFAKFTARGTRGFFFSPVLRVSALLQHFTFLSHIFALLFFLHVPNYHSLGVLSIGSSPLSLFRLRLERNLRLRDESDTDQGHTQRIQIFWYLTQKTCIAIDAAFVNTSSKGPLRPCFLYAANHHSTWLPLPCLRLLSL